MLFGALTEPVLSFQEALGSVQAHIEFLGMFERKYEDILSYIEETPVFQLETFGLPDFSRYLDFRSADFISSYSRFSRCRFAAR